MLKHEHLIIRALVENPPKDVEKTNEWMKQLIEKIGMKLLAGPMTVYLDKEGNRGLTTVSIIETSHIAMHVWDEHDPALIQLDIYTCSKLDLDVAFEHFNVYNPISINYLFLDRENEITVL